MKQTVLILFWASLVLTGCHHGKTEESVTTADTLTMMVAQIQRCSRLYTAEAHVHKIVTHDDQLKLKGSLLKSDFDIPLPGGKRKVAIPMEATVKAYIDFSGFSDKNVKRKGEKITITLPDPKVVLTSTKIDHEGIRQYVALTRSDFSDEELSAYEQEGRKDIIAGIPAIGIVETARRSATHTLVPMLTEMGVKAENITVCFRKKFGVDDLRSLLQDATSVEKKEKSY